MADKKSSSTFGGEYTPNPDAPFIPELVEYFTRRKLPEDHLLREIAKGKAQNPEITGDSVREQREFLASLQMLDIEFQAEIKPYMPLGSEIDPSRAHFVPLSKEVRETAPLGISALGLTRYSGGEDRMFHRYKDPSGNIHEIGPFLKNTVNTVGVEGSRPAVWAHEYRHWEGTDYEDIFRNEEGYPYFDDSKINHRLGNFLLDVIAAQTKDDWVGAIGLITKESRREAKQNFNKEGATEAQKEKALEQYTQAGAIYNSTRDSESVDLEEMGSFVKKLITEKGIPIEKYSDEIAQGPWFRKYVRGASFYPTAEELNKRSYPYKKPLMNLKY
jgi:hypothetical protein